jgi:hypothetical protein
VVRIVGKEGILQITSIRVEYRSCSNKSVLGAEYVVDESIGEQAVAGTAQIHRRSSSGNCPGIGRPSIFARSKVVNVKLPPADVSIDAEVPWPNPLQQLAVHGKAVVCRTRVVAVPRARRAENHNRRWLIR